MALTSSTDLKARMLALMGVAWSGLSSDAQDNAVSQTLEELGWVVPILIARKAYWVIERCKRHTLYTIIIVQAERFQYKQIKLQNKFENYFKLITEADKAFAKALEDDPVLMSVLTMDLETTALYAKGFLMNPAGFVYDQMGRDLTYAYWDI